MKLRIKLNAVFVLLAILPLLLVGSIINFQVYNIQKERAITLQEARAAHVAYAVSKFVEENQNFLYSLSDMSGVSELPVLQQTVFFSDVLLYSNRFAGISLIDETGHELIHLSRFKPFESGVLNNLSGSEAFLHINLGGSYYGPVRFDSILGEPVMTIAFSLQKKVKGSQSLFVLADLRLKDIWNIIAEISSVSSGEVYVLDKTGKVIAHENPAVVLKGTSVIVPASSGIQVGLDGKKVILAVERVNVGDQTLFVVAEQDYYVALNLAFRALGIMFVSLLLLLIVAQGVGIHSLHTIVRPIESLAKSVRDMSSGKFNLRAKVEGDEEIRILASAFNQMSSQLNRQMRGLEKRVKQRTRELEKKTAEIERFNKLAVGRELRMIELKKKIYGSKRE